MNTVKQLKVEEESWLFPTWDLEIKHPIKLRGIQIINTGLDKYEYEAIVFDPIPKCSEYLLKINFFENKPKIENQPKLEMSYMEFKNNINFMKPSTKADCIFIELDDFEIISDTCIRFRLSRIWDPELYDFELL